MIFFLTKKFNRLNKKGDRLMSKIKKEPQVNVSFTDGWKDRVALAAYNLFLEVENNRTKKLKESA